jgi:hypothetical protein
VHVPGWLKSGDTGPASERQPKVAGNRRMLLIRHILASLETWNQPGQKAYDLPSITKADPRSIGAFSTPRDFGYSDGLSMRGSSTSALTLVWGGWVSLVSRI